MKYSKDEYEDLIIKLNLNKNKKFMIISSLISAVVGFALVMFLMGSEVYFSIVMGIIISFTTHYVLKKGVYDNAKKANFTKDIIAIEQEIREDKITELVKRVNNVEDCGEYYYSDVAYVKEDKENFYLYLNNNSAIIVNKVKLNDIENFKKVLQSNNLLK